MKSVLHCGLVLVTLLLSLLYPSMAAHGEEGPGRKPAVLFLSFSHPRLQPSHDYMNLLHAKGYEVNNILCIPFIPSALTAHELRLFSFGVIWVGCQDRRLRSAWPASTTISDAHHGHHFRVSREGNG